jgi:hypothetical protein
MKSNSRIKMVIVADYRYRQKCILAVLNGNFCGIAVVEALPGNGKSQGISNLEKKIPSNLLR